MRIRSALAAVVLGAALAAAGATSAGAADRHYEGGDDNVVCSPYFGGIDTSSSDLFWGGAHCGTDVDYGLSD
ncbi:hypothetical protein [Streptomyces bobili]|jgi:hypothetical protein|uniref:hypothetical protein n=1 Tax=Streptomyces bobili TaxID=67280 RepID=UPI000A3922BF|nr:hypothetical protein [Streptomyces bobili]